MEDLIATELENTALNAADEPSGPRTPSFPTTRFKVGSAYPPALPRPKPPSTSTASGTT